MVSADVYMGKQTEAAAARDVDALRALVHGLASACLAAGEKRVLRRVEATAARIFSRL